MRAFSFLIVAMTLVGCAANTSQRTLYTYGPFAPETNADGSIKCTASQKSFTTLKAECQALENETLNNSCALAQRQAEFAKQCPGQTFKSINLPKAPPAAAANTPTTPSESDKAAGNL